MTWVGISGSWKYPQVTEADVTREVTALLKQGKGIVTGGALGVDFTAAVTAMDYNPEKLKIILPTSLDTFIDHHYARADQGIITLKQADDLAWFLWIANRNGCVEEHPERKIVGKTSYFARNQDVVDASDELCAFRVNNSGGTGDTIRRAKEKGIPVRTFSYKVQTWQ